MHIYAAKLFGWSIFTESFSDDDLAINWPCGNRTELSNPNLFDIGTAIGEHAIECEVCENVGTTAGRGSASGNS